MAALQEVKQEIVDLLSATIPTYSYIPDRITPPVAIITPGSPYLQENGQTYGRFLVRFNLDVAMPTQSNQKVTEALDTTVTSIVEILAANRFGIDNVSAPYTLESNNAGFLAVTITIETTILIQGE